MEDIQIKPVSPQEQKRFCIKGIISTTIAIIITLLIIRYNTLLDETEIFIFYAIVSVLAFLEVLFILALTGNQMMSNHNQMKK